MTTFTGFTDLDRLTGGLLEGSLIVGASPPGVGKSSFALSIAANMIRREPEPVYGADIGMREVRQAVALFSLQSSKEQVFEKMVAMIGNLPLRDLHSGTIGAEEWPYLVRSVVDFSRSPMFINDSASITLQEIRTSLTNVSQGLNSTSLDGAKVELGLVILDHLPLMLPREGSLYEREEFAAGLLRELKRLARDLGVPVLVLSQLQHVVDRHDKRPLISDFDPSEPVDQFADMLVLLYRDEFYNPASDDKGVAEVIVAKNRNGPTGGVKMAFRERFGGRLVSLAR